MVYKQNWIIPTVIVIALLSVWMGVASGQNFSIQLIPQHSVIQGSVTLRVTGIPTNNQTLVWYKGEDASKDNKILNIPFNPATLHDSGLKNHERIRPFPNGSLLIFNLEKTDEGNYILTKGPQVQTCVYLKVYGEETEPSGSDVGTIIGLGIGAVLLFALVAVFISFLVLRRQRQKITICLDVTTNDKDAPRKERGGRVPSEGASSGYDVTAPRTRQRKAEETTLERSIESRKC
ncbi:carcinoembryonic antigen-related cell adhesion molecule 4-like [Hyperolius riggenbachi]|uniref:carcinoembryonic antigen-related cell adhesion molecule 4-like n=1 Tax=Hyperolius riggenbachi TaxID=752182 RepID=UPI0035A3361D